jgi:hypothetical protein
MAAGDPPGRPTPVGNRLARQWPERLGRLQLRRAGRQPAEHQVRRHDPPLGHVPAGVVHQDHLQFAPFRAGPAREFLQGQAHPVGVVRGQEQLQVATAGRMDEAVDVEPLILGPARGTVSPSAHHPDAAGDRLEPQPGLLLGPELDRLAGILPAQLGNPPRRDRSSRPVVRPRWRPWGGTVAAPGARGTGRATILSRSSCRPLHPSGLGRRRGPWARSRARRRGPLAGERPTGRCAGRSRACPGRRWRRRGGRPGPRLFTTSGRRGPRRRSGRPRLEGSYARRRDSHRSTDHIPGAHRTLTLEPALSNVGEFG